MPRGEKVILREKRVTDADRDYDWRCDADLNVLDAAPPVRLTRREYAAFCSDEIRYPSKHRRRFAIESLDGRHIGNCMYYDIDESSRQAELGVMIGEREFWGQGYGTDAVRTLLRHIFETTRIERVYLKTLVWNVRAQRSFSKSGFIECGRVSKNGNEFVIMELHRKWFERLHAQEAGRDSAATQEQSS